MANKFEGLPENSDGASLHKGASFVPSPEQLQKIVNEGPGKIEFEGAKEDNRSEGEVQKASHEKVEEKAIEKDRGELKDEREKLKNLYRGDAKKSPEKKDSGSLSEQRKEWMQEVRNRIKEQKMFIEQGRSDLKQMNDEIKNLENQSFFRNFFSKFSGRFYDDLRDKKGAADDKAREINNMIENLGRLENELEDTIVGSEGSFAVKGMFNRE